MCSALDEVSAWASVLATTNSQPWSPLAIMLLTAFPPAPPTPNTVIRGFSSRTSGVLILIDMVASSLGGCCPPGLGRSATGKCQVEFRSSEALPQPAPDARHVASGSGVRVLHQVWLEMFQVRRLRIDQEARRRRKGSPLRLLGKPRDAERPADADLPSENPRGELDQAGELAGASSQDHTPARLGRERRRIEPITHHLQNLLHPWPHDPHQLGARYELGTLVPVVIDWRDGDHVPLVRTARENAAIQRLDSLGFGNACVQSAGDIHRHVMTADREAVAVNESPAREH